MTFAVVVKRAIEVTSPSSYAPNRLLASTVGRAIQAPFAPFAHQEQAFQHVAGPEREASRRKLDQLVQQMAAKYPKETDDLAIRLNGPDTIDDLRRLWHSKRNTYLERVLATPFVPIRNTVAALTRADNYDPSTNAMTLYSGTPDTAAAMLGEAVTANKIKSPQLRALYGTVTGQTFPGAGAARGLGEMAAAKAMSEEDTKEMYRHTPSPMTAAVGSPTAGIIAAPLQVLAGALSGPIVRPLNEMTANRMTRLSRIEPPAKAANQAFRIGEAIGLAFRKHANAA